MFHLDQQAFCISKFTLLSSSPPSFQTITKNVSENAGAPKLQSHGTHFCPGLLCWSGSRAQLPRSPPVAGTALAPSPAPPWARPSPPSARPSRQGPRRRLHGGSGRLGLGRGGVWVPRFAEGSTTWKVWEWVGQGDSK